jgi:hypothetical protein
VFHIYIKSPEGIPNTGGATHISRFHGKHVFHAKTADLALSGISREMYIPIIELDIYIHSTLHTQNTETKYLTTSYRESSILMECNLAMDTSRPKCVDGYSYEE